MDNEDKRLTRERHERFLKKHYRTHEEEKRLRREAQARKATRHTTRRRGRSGGAHDAEDADEFERIPRARAKAPTGTGHELPPSPLELPPDAETALVVAVHRTHVSLRVDGHEVDARTREPLVVGDRVWFNGPAEHRVVVARDARRSQLARATHTGPHVIVANVDLGIIVTSLRRPEPRPGLIDRVRVALAAGGVEPLVVINKVDLLTPEERAALPELLTKLGLAEPAPICTSAETGEGLAELRERLRAQTAVFVGHSGVGKSSLLNALRPGTDQAVSSGRAFDGKGRHTTTSSSLWELEGNAHVIDTPGVRSFALEDVAPQDLAAAFPEIAELAARCRFRGCSHGVEPECAVRAAVESGALAESRWAAYQKLAKDAPD